MSLSADHKIATGATPLHAALAANWADIHETIAEPYGRF